MREFLLTVTVNNLTTEQNIDFLVGESSTALCSSEAEEHPAKLTRKFTVANNSREIYFSATSAFSANSELLNSTERPSGKVIEIDLSQAGGATAEATYTKNQAPGIMVPGQTYYVHVYSDGDYIGKQAVTTAAYPGSSVFGKLFDDSNTNDPPAPSAGGPVNYNEHYLWGQQMWYDTSGNYRGVEVRTDEINLMPLRFMQPLDQTIASANHGRCTKPTNIMFFISGSEYVMTINGTSLGGISGERSLIWFRDSENIAITPSNKRDNSFDAMLFSKGNNSSYNMILDCNKSGLPLLSSSAWTYYTVITE